MQGHACIPVPELLGIGCETQGLTAEIAEAMDGHMAGQVQPGAAALSALTLASTPTQLPIVPNTHDLKGN